MKVTACWLAAFVVGGVTGLHPVISRAGQDPPPRSQPEPPAAGPVAPPRDPAPEATLRAFLLAMVARDEPALHDLTLPNAGFEWLLRGEKLTSDQLAAARAAITAQPIRPLQAGEEFTLPGNRKIVVRPDEVADGRAVLVPEGAPVPTRLRQVGGKWKVDVGPLIAARKAADAARKAAEKSLPPAEKARRAAEALRLKAAEDAQGRAAPPVGPEP